MTAEPFYKMLRKPIQGQPDNGAYLKSLRPLELPFTLSDKNYTLSIGIFQYVTSYYQMN
jgi:hypothetical protein